MKGRKRSPIDEWVCAWEGAVEQLLIPIDSQVGGYPDYVHLADYEGWLVAREEAANVLAEAAPAERAPFEERLRDADTTFVEKTDPDTMHLLRRARVIDVPEEDQTRLWLNRVPKHGVFRRALERRAESAV